MNIKKHLEKLENLWMTPIREEQKEYCKPFILNPQDGSDWRRIKV